LVEAAAAFFPPTHARGTFKIKQKELTLIQQQKGGVEVQSARERDAHAPPSRELAALLGLHRLVEPEAVQDLRGAHLGQVGIERVEAVFFGGGVGVLFLVGFLGSGCFWGGL
jgi:hypothetical protein